MKRIEIHSVYDIKNIQKLIGDEDYYIFVNLPHNVVTDSIDLSVYNGHIYLSLDDKYHKLKINVYDKHKVFLFFEGMNLNNCSLIGSTKTYNCEYVEKEREIHINQESELRKTIKLPGKIRIILDSNIVIHGAEPITIPNNVIINANLHKIFCPQNIEIISGSNNDAFEICDQIVAIKGKDLRPVRIEKGSLITRDELVRQLNNFGYNRKSSIAEIGDYVADDYVVSVYLKREDTPVRFEFADGKVNSICYIDVDTQRKISELEKIDCSSMSKEVNLDKLYSLDGKNVVIEFRDDIDGISMNSIDVPNNVKKLFVLGQGHTISNVTMLGSVYNGLFSTIPASTSVYVENLNFNNVHLICDSDITERAGLVFGTHGIGRYHAYPEPVEIRNCSFVDNRIDNCKYFVGLISGSDSGETNVVDCYFEQNHFNYEVYSFKGNKHKEDMLPRLFGAHDVKRIISCDENGNIEFSWKKSNVSEKRLVRKMND